MEVLTFPSTLYFSKEIPSENLKRMKKSEGGTHHEND